MSCLALIIFFQFLDQCYLSMYVGIASYAFGVFMTDFVFRSNQTPSICLNNGNNELGNFQKAETWLSQVLFAILEF